MKYFLTFLFLTFSLFAHPHVFVDVYPKIEDDSINLRWVFDEMTSNMLIMDYDTNRDGKISPTENKVIEKDIFITLEKYSYYTYFYKGKKQLPATKAHNFMASIHNSQLVFTFELSRDANADSIHFYDAENYTAYELTQEFVKKANPKHPFKVYSHEFDYYYGYILELK